MDVAHQKLYTRSIPYGCKLTLGCSVRTKWSSPDEISLEKPLLYQPRRWEKK